MFVIVDHSSVLTVNVLVKLRCCYEKRKDEWSTRLFLSNLKIGHILVALFFDHHIIDLQSYHNLSCEPLQINYESNKQVYNLRHVLFISQILRYLHQIKWWSETHGWPTLTNRSHIVITLDDASHVYHTCWELERWRKLDYCFFVISIIVIWARNMVFLYYWKSNKNKYWSIYWSKWMYRMFWIVLFWSLFNARFKPLYL